MKVLALSFHADDTDIACSATLDKYKSSGNEVEVLCFSWLSNESLKDEFKEANKNFVVGGPKIEFDFRNPDASRLRDVLYEWSLKTNPDLILCPSSADCHQAHEIMHNETVRIFKHISILGYEMPWNSLRPIHHTAFCKINRENLEAKKTAIACYKSQSHRTYTQPEYIESLARVRGQQAGCEFAEQFEVIRWFL